MICTAQLSVIHEGVSLSLDACHVYCLMHLWCSWYRCTLHILRHDMWTKNERVKVLIDGGTATSVRVSEESWTSGARAWRRGGICPCNQPQSEGEKFPRWKNNSVRQRANGMITNSPSSALLRQIGYQRVGDRDCLGVWNHFQEDVVTSALMQFESTEMGTRRTDHVPVNAEGLWSHNALGPLRKEIWVGELLQAVRTRD